MRRRIGYSIRRSRKGYFSAYIFSHGEIKKGCPRGIWQFDLVAHGGRRIPYLFFTCPKCGKINKNYVYMDAYSMRRTHYVEYCHNCRFCQAKVPFNVEGGLRKLRAERQKTMERAGLGEREEESIDSLYVQFVEAMTNGSLTAVGKQDFIGSYRLAFKNVGHNDFDTLLESVPNW